MELPTVSGRRSELMTTYEAGPAAEPWIMLYPDELGFHASKPRAVRVITKEVDEPIVDAVW
jgi:hypothetical protein